MSRGEATNRLHKKLPFTVAIPESPVVELSRSLIETLIDFDDRKNGMSDAALRVEVDRLIGFIRREAGAYDDRHFWATRGEPPKRCKCEGGSFDCSTIPPVEDET